MQGTQGTLGLQGVQGTQGTLGLQGVQGRQGTQGTLGIQGTQGTLGIQGVQGTQGTLGIQGIQGTQGTLGIQGVQGTQGTLGLQGIQGTQGTQGRQGIQGITGPIAGTDGQVIYNNGGIAGGANVYYDDTNERLGVGNNAPAAKLDLVETWNNVSNTFTHIKSNVTDTASAVASLLMDLQIGGATKFKISKNGDVSSNTVIVNTNTILSSEATTLATITKTQVASFPVASFRSGKLIVQAYDSVSGDVQISELLVVHNGTTASATEYGVVFTGTGSIVLYDVDISSGNVRLMATRTTANSTQYKISETLIVA